MDLVSVAVGGPRSRVRYGKVSGRILPTIRTGLSASQRGIVECGSKADLAKLHAHPSLTLSRN